MTQLRVINNDNSIKNMLMPRRDGKLYYEFWNGRIISLVSCDRSLNQVRNQFSFQFPIVYATEVLHRSSHFKVSRIIPLVSLLRRVRNQFSFPFPIVKFFRRLCVICHILTRPQDTCTYFLVNRFFFHHLLPYIRHDPIKNNNSIVMIECWPTRK